LSLKSKTTPFLFILSILSLLLAGNLQAQVSVRIVPGENQKIHILGGGWDHDKNGYPEYFAIHDPQDSLGISRAYYYEDTGDTTLAVVWQYALDPAVPARIVDGTLTDLDRDGLPELILLIHYNMLSDGDSPAWLQVFAWDSATNRFAAAPTFSWRYRGQGISYLRPTRLAVADMDIDGAEDLVITIGSPDRMVLIAGWQGSGLRASQELRPGGTTDGSWSFSTAVADLNGDLRKDLLLVGHGPRPALQAYINGIDGFHRARLPRSLATSIKPNGIAVGDHNWDGQEEVLIPLIDGSLVAVGMAGPGLQFEIIATDMTQLVDLVAQDIDGDSTAELIYLLEDGTVTTNDATIQPPITPDLLNSQLPSGVRPPLVFHSLAIVPPTPERPALLLLPVQSDSVALLVFASIGNPSAPAPLPGMEALPVRETLSALPGLGPAAKRQEPYTAAEVARKIYYPGTAGAPDPRALPPNRTPDILLYVGNEFSRSAIGERTEKSASFRFLTKAPDMIFNFLRQTIEWQPTLEHLGAWNVVYEITYFGGVEPQGTIMDSTRDFRAAPTGDVIREQLLFYVNDPPEIVSQPENLRLLAGNLFAYRISVNDRNSDARLDYRLESGPEGMTIDQGGILTWRTNETHHDDYQVVISVSDGFDRDIQSFTLNVNAQLTITSAVPRATQAGEPYEYQVTYFQPGARKEQVFSLPSAPEDMHIDQTGRLHWTPSPGQLDTQRFQVRITDGTAEDVQEGWVYVNALPEFTLRPQPISVVEAGDTLRLGFSGHDPNTGQSLTWSVFRGPVEMIIDSTGQLVWATSLQDIDATPYTVELSDGIGAVRHKGVAYVNRLVRITSMNPPDTATVRQAYSYAVQTRDENQSAVLKYRRPTVVANTSRTVTYEVNLQDDKFKREYPRYLAQFKQQKNIFINKPAKPTEGEVAQAARIDLKLHVKQIFAEDDRLVLVITNPDQGVVTLEDVLWEFFQGGRGIMPKYTAEVVPYTHFSLLEFPDGMTVSHDGVIDWTPAIAQAGLHPVRLMVSDGFTRDEQTFQIYANYPPAIISQADTLAQVEQPYTYQVRVDDKNDDAKLNYRLAGHPPGMAIDSKGLVTWMPTLEQINWREFEVVVSDGHAADHQATTLFINSTPRVISQPKAVALDSYEYTYRLVAEDLNQDDIRYKAIKIPRYSDFDVRTGLFRWRPRGVQKGANDIAFEIIDTHGGVTVHEFQVHVFEDPARKRMLFTGWPLLLAFAGALFVLGISIGA